jgi:hypothetical protein
MRSVGIKHVVYLFGAGATHAELRDLEPDLADQGQGLLINDVSTRVIERARKRSDYIRDVEMVSGASGSLNIELLISLLESAKITNWARKTDTLKRLVKSDIKSILTSSRKKKFYLHRGLLELHKHASLVSGERLSGLISLNYDDVLDDAYQEHFGAPNYCFSLNGGGVPAEALPLLKLHGSFNWNNTQVTGRKRSVEIIPLGSAKTYLHIPYAFIWNRALEVLTRCDVLRVIGCSLNQNDAHLIDLLFKAHLERAKPIEIEIIASERTGDAIRTNYGFFPWIKTLTKIDSLVPDPDPENPYKEWLKYKCLSLLGTEDIQQTAYLKRVVI